MQRYRFEITIVATFPQNLLEEVKQMARHATTQQYEQPEDADMKAMFIFPGISQAQDFLEEFEVVRVEDAMAQEAAKQLQQWATRVMKKYPTLGEE